MNAELYINDYLIDLEPGTSNIGVTFQVNDIAELKDRKANTTNQFKIPKTANNRKALGFTDQVNALSRLPYRKLPAKYVENGIEVITNGVAIIEDAAVYFNVQVLSGNYDFFEQLKNKMLTDIDLSELDHAWTLANIYASRGFTEADGYCYPIIDYTGSDWWFNRGTAGGIRPEMLFPAVFVRKLFNKLTLASGYKLAGSFFEKYSDSEPGLGNRLIIPFCGDGINHTQVWIDNRTAKALSIIDQVVPSGGSKRLQFENEITDISSFGTDIPGQGYQYIPTGSASEMYCHIRLELNIDSTLNPAYFRIDVERFLISDGLWHSGAGFESNAKGVRKLTLDSRNISGFKGFYIRPGDGIRCFLVASSGAGSINIKSGSTVEFIPGKTAFFGNEIQLGPCLPAMTQTDFIKSICNQFCLIPVTDDVTKEVRFNLFSDVYKNKGIARDWSNKIDMSQPPQISFRYGRYGQKNNLKYAKDDAVTEGLGDGSFTIDDGTLESNIEIATLAFAPTEMKNYDLLPLTVPFIKVYNETTPPSVVPYRPLGDSVPVKPRILLHHFYLDPDGYVTYVDADGFLILRPFELPMAWFIAEPDTIPARPIPNNLGFDNSIIDDFYDGIKTMTDRFKKVTAYFKLNAVDVQNFDHMIPVYIDHFNEYFFVNKISNYKPNQLTSVELYRL